MAKHIRNIDSVKSVNLTNPLVDLALENLVSLGWVDQVGDRYKLNNKGRVRANVVIQIQAMMQQKAGASDEEIKIALPHIEPTLIQEVLDIFFKIV